MSSDQGLDHPWLVKEAPPSIHLVWSPLCGPQVNGATLVHLITGALWGLNLTEEPGRGEVGMNSHFMLTQAFFHPTPPYS